MIACLALLVALGGTSIAAISALPASSVGTKQLKNDAVTSAKVKDASLQGGDFAPGVLWAPNTAFAKFRNGPVWVGTSWITLASLDIPVGGWYVIWAKAYFTTPGQVVGTVTCDLRAEADWDRGVANGQNATLETVVAHNFAGPTSKVDFRCSATSGTPQANFVKVTAIKVDELTNTGS